MYSSSADSQSEFSVSKAHQDLDRCAAILNDVLDNGPGIIDGIKQRKSRSQEQIVRPRQTNRALVSTSTPQITPLIQRHRRCRSSSARASSSSSFKPVTRKRQRSLSEQSLNHAKSRLRSLVSKVDQKWKDDKRHSSQQDSAPNSAYNSASMVANLSASSADTLTGVHLDNSSEYGVPPVFSTNNNTGRRSVERRSRSRHRGNLIWYKPQTSISTQTLPDKENQKISKSAKSSKMNKSCKRERNQFQQQTRPVRVPSVDDFKSPTPKKSLLTSQQQQPSYKLTKRAERKPRSSTPSSSCEREAPQVNRSLTEIRDRQTAVDGGKEHDVDEILERTIRADEHSFQQPVIHSLVTQMSQDKGTNQQLITISDEHMKMLERLNTAALNNDMTEFGKIFTEIKDKMLYSVRNQPNAQHQTNIDQLILPFKREVSDLQQHIKYLESQLQKLPPPEQDLMKRITELSLRLERSEAQVTQLRHDLENKNSADQNKQRNTQSHNHQVELKDLRIKSQLKTIRTIHTALARISALGDVNIRYQVDKVMELCAHEILDCINDQSIHVDEENRNNNSLSESTGLSSETPVRDTPTSNVRDTSQPVCDLPQRYSMTQYFQQYHPHSYEKILSPSKPDRIPEQPAPCPAHRHTQRQTGYQPEPMIYQHVSPAYARDPIQSGPPLYQPGTSSEEPLHSTLISASESTISGDSSLSSLSLATTVADNLFQDGLAQLDANIARLQDSLKSKDFNFSI